jgi:hypothetical protein
MQFSLVFSLLYQMDVSRVLAGSSHCTTRYITLLLHDLLLGSSVSARTALHVVLKRTLVTRR